MKSFAAPLGALAILLGGCTVIQTTDNNVANTTGIGERLATYSLPRSLLTVKIEIDKTKTLRTFEVTPVIVPDEKARYGIRYVPGYLAEDQVCIARSPNGLLSQVSVVTSDRTIDIAVNIAEAIARIFVAPPGTRQTTATAAEMTTLTLTIDPRDSNSIQGANAAIARLLGPDHSLNLSAIQSLDKSALVPDISGLPGSVYFRTNISRVVALNGPKGVAVASDSVDVIDPGSTAAVDIRRAFFVEKVTRVVFRDGVLVGVTVKKPSEALSLSEAPLRIIDRILSIPAGFFAKAFGNKDPGSSSLKTDAQDLSDARKKLEEARKTPAPGTTINLSDVTKDNEKVVITCK